MNRKVRFNEQWLLRHRMLAVIVIQLLIVMASYLLSFFLRMDPFLFDFNFDALPWDVITWTLPLIVSLRMGALLGLGLHRRRWRYFGVADIQQIVKATTLSSLVFVFVMVATQGFSGYPRSVVVLDWAGNIVMLGGASLLVRMGRERLLSRSRRRAGLKRLLIVGAGDSGASLCEQAVSNAGFQFIPVAFLDGSADNIGTSIMGVPVVGGYQDVPRAIRNHRIESGVLADPDVEPAQVRSLVNDFQQANVQLQVLPSTSDILDGRVSISRIRDVDPVDLLGRRPARLDLALIRKFVANKRVLVTGAGGSVGSELARHLAGGDLESLLLIDRSENPLFLLETELRAIYQDDRIVCRVDDVTDYPSMTSLLDQFRPQLVFHAAAHKHVPLMERSPAQAIKNNIGGTYWLAKCAISAGAEKFLLVSTDKAANPSSVMGATKRVAEMVVQELSGLNTTQCISVRFGNVIGSNASVVPIFKEQIANGGPVTVTHPEVERYFMSVSEASGLILQAAAIGKAGETFVLEMGEPVLIRTLAETLISLSGLKPYEDIGIVFTGLRPGEKLSEVLHSASDRLEPTGHEKLLVLKQHAPKVNIVKEVDRLLTDLSCLQPEEILDSLRVLVPEFKPAVSAGR